MGDVIQSGFSGRGLGFYGMSNACVLEGTHKVDTAMEAAGLNWVVDKIPSGYEGPDGEFIASGARFNQTQRRDTKEILGQVGKQYTVFNNAEAFAFADELLEYGADFHAAGSYKNSSHVFLIAKLPEGIKVEGEEDMDLYLDMINTHDGTGSISWYATPIRRNCTNQTRLMIAKAVSSAKIRHTASASERVAQVSDTLKLVSAYKSELESGITTLQSIEMDLEEVDTFLNEWSDSKRVVKNVLETYNTSALVPRGTAWGVINSITETLLHNPARTTGGESRWASNLDGPNNTHVGRASRMLLTRRNA